MSKRIAVVECTVRVEVELPDDPNYDPTFDIEENHCPGTGIVGAALDTKFAAGHEHGSACWACPGGKNKIIEIREAP